jgi:hypothetical protein
MATFANTPARAVSSLASVGRHLVEPIAWSQGSDVVVVLVVGQVVVEPWQRQGSASP